MGHTWISSQDGKQRNWFSHHQSVKEMKVQAVQILEESILLLMKNVPEEGIAHVRSCEDYSDFSRLCRITAYAMRFVNIIKAQSLKPVSVASEKMFFSESLWIEESLPLNQKF